MDADKINRFKELEQKYIDSNLLSNGRPDTYQYHQNELCKCVAAFLLEEYWNYKESIDDISDHKDKYLQ